MLPVPGDGHGPAERDRVAPAWAPLCMSGEEWTDWQRLNPRYRIAAIALRDVAERPCADCPAWFAAENRKVGKCNGTPGGTEADDDWDPSLPRPAALHGKPAEVYAPCSGCAFAEICAIRRTIPPTIEVVQLNRLHHALTAQPTIHLDCEEYRPRPRGRPMTPARLLRVAPPAVRGRGKVVR